MAGFLDFLSPVNADGTVDPQKMGMLNMLAAGARSSQPTELPTSRLGNIMGVLSAYGQGAGEAAQLNPKLGLLQQEQRGARIKNDLSQLDLNHFNSLQPAANNPVAGLLQGGGGAPGALNNGGAQPPLGMLNGGGALPPGGGGNGGFVLSPRGMLARAQDLGSYPAGQAGALQMLKLYENSVPKSSGVMANGVIAPFAGAPESEFTMANAKSTGETLGKNNGNEVVAPGAALIRGPRTPAELAASLQGGGTAPSYVNPNSAATNVTLHAGNTLVDAALKGAGDNLGDSQKTAQAAMDSLPAIAQAKALVPQIFSGPGSTIQQGLARIFTPDDPRLAATSGYLRAVGSMVGNLARQVGGPQVSDSDRKSAEKLAGGDFNLSRGELASVLDFAERAGLQSRASHNQRAEKYISAAPKEVQGMLRATQIVDLPPGYTQPAAPQAAAPPGVTLNDIQAEMKRRGL